ncbi:MAG: multiple sugar transport system substrate-binding protein [Chloroflexota bacterium]|nr:multiple sugar transport system substrate-binding protein [Chloroflexota bacterium]
MAISITMSRRTFLQRLAVLGAVSASAAACTPAPAAPVAPQAAEPAKPAAAATQPAAAPAAKVEIKGSLQIIQKQDFFPSMNDWFQAEVKAFCKEKGWPVEVSYEAGYTGGTPFIEKLAAAASAGTPADLLMHTDAMVDLVRLKVVDPVTDIVNQVSAKWGNPSARQKFDMVKDSLWYYVPYFQRSDGGWFQRPVFKDKGIDLAKIRSYKDLWEACLAVTDPGKQIYGWGVTINRGGDGDWFRNRVMHGWGAYVQDETGQYVTINSPQMVEAMTTMTDLYLKDKW